jgi:hypothetical protein
MEMLFRPGLLLLILPSRKMPLGGRKCSHWAVALGGVDGMAGVGMLPSTLRAVIAGTGAVA